METTIMAQADLKEAREESKTIKCEHIRNGIAPAYGTIVLETRSKGELVGRAIAEFCVECACVW